MKVYELNAHEAAAAYAFQLQLILLNTTREVVTARKVCIQAFAMRRKVSARRCQRQRRCGRFIFADADTREREIADDLRACVSAPAAERSERYIHARISLNAKVSDYRAWYEDFLFMPPVLLIISKISCRRQLSLMAASVLRMPE